VSKDNVAGGEVAVPAFDDFGDSASGHHLSDLDRRGVRATGVHASAHVRVQRQVKRPEQNLLALWSGDLGLDYAKVRERRLTCRPRRQQDLRVLVDACTGRLACRHGSPWIATSPS